MTDRSRPPSPVERGRLSEPDTWPATGERFVPVAELGGVRVEEILSGPEVAPEDHDQAHDEWVLVVQGAATLSVGDERIALVAGDWLLLPAHVRHRVEWIEPGTRWLAVHADG